MKKLSLLFAAIVCVISVNAKTIYCKMEHSWWTQASAAIAIHAWNSDGDKNVDAGELMTLVPGETCIWQFELDDKYTSCLFKRVNSSGTEYWGSLTEDQTIPDDKNLFTITSADAKWDGAKCVGTWSQYTPPVLDEHVENYYLQGYINGKDYENSEEYQFVDGKLELTLTAESYVFVQDNRKVNYKTEGWVGKELTSITLYQNLANGDKWFVPAGVITFTLVENEDGSITLSFVDNSTTSALENVEVKTSTRKIIENGQIYILRDGVRYNVLGAQVK